jgi:hypothetical protein
MNYNSDLPGGKQATKGDKQKLTVIYYMDYSLLSNIRQHNEMEIIKLLTVSVTYNTYRENTFIHIHTYLYV